MIKRKEWEPGHHRAGAYGSEIQRTLHLFESSAWHTMGVNHSSSDVTVTKKRLNRADVIICLKQVRGKRVAEGMGGDALGELGPPDCLVKRQLDVCFMKMIAPQLPGTLHKSQ